MKILIADPAKNITVFVLDPPENPAARTAIARSLLADSKIGAEQVGFVIPPGKPTARRDPALWRLEMMGGEFCGNASRSFGLYIARLTGLKGRSSFPVSVSGMNQPVLVEADPENGWAAVEMPKPLFAGTLNYKDRLLPVLGFEGIVHVIAPDTAPENDTFYAIKKLVESGFSIPPALGVMFYDTASRFMRPAVYVRSTDSLVFESSCGSGSAALGAWLCRELADGQARFDLSQPGGIIEAVVTKKAGEIRKITIGGKVHLGEVLDTFV